MPGARKYAFTINTDPTTFYHDMAAIQTIHADVITYICGQMELSSTGHRHFQGYIQLKTKKGYSWLRDNVCSGHYEVQRGTNTECRDYTMKEDTRLEEWIEFGRFVKGQGSRVDMTRIRRQVDAGDRLGDIVHNCDSLGAIRLAEKLVSYVEPTTDFIIKEVIWYWGKTGTGKTHAAYDLIDSRNTSHWRALGNGTWFNGYDGQEIVLIDELRAKNWPYTDLLTLLDGYQVKKEMKYGFTIWRPKTVIVTTPHIPEDTYAGTMEHVDGGISQLLRRITSIREFI